MFPQDMLRNLSLWFFKMFPHDALAGANEIAAMAVEEKLSANGLKTSMGTDVEFFAL
jgi:hypothetical protein